MATREVGVLPPERRRALLETAIQEFARSGYERASLNRVIRACGMSKSSFYHYFGSKDALFDAVVTEVGAELVARLRVPEPDDLSGPCFWDRVAELMDHLVALTRDDRFTDLAKLFYLPDAPADPDRPLHRARSGIDAWLEGAVRAGRASGVVRTDLPAPLQTRLTLAVMWAMDEWSVAHMNELNAARLSLPAEAQLDAVRRLLAP